jgi:hypothetical protein
VHKDPKENKDLVVFLVDVGPVVAQDRKDRKVNVANKDLWDQLDLKDLRVKLVFKV